MKKLILLTLVITLNTACVSAFETRKEEPNDQYFAINGTKELAQRNDPNYQKQWSKWDKKYVSDDVILVEILVKKDQK